MAQNRHSIYNKINNLLTDDLKKELVRIREELEQSKADVKNLKNSLAQESNAYVKSSVPPPPPVSSTDRSHDFNYSTRTLYDTFYDPNFNRTKIKNQPQLMSRSPFGTISTKKKPIPVIDKTNTINDISTYTPATHKVRVSTRVTSQDQENGMRKIIGMDTVEWWEYVLIYGFLKATKIAYEYNIVKDMIKNPTHIVSLVNKGALVLTFTPINNIFNKKENIIWDENTNQDVIVKTGTIYREFQLPIEIPYITGTRTEEVKKGFFLYEETFETIEPDYEALGKKVAKELDDKKINEDFKQIIANELNNGRISRI